MILLVESKESGQRCMEGDLETVEAYQLQLVMHQQSQITEAEDDNSRDEDSTAETGICMHHY